MLPPAPLIPPLRLPRLAAALFALGFPALAAGHPALKDAYRDDFLVGAAINRAIATDTPIQTKRVTRPAGQIKEDVALVTAQFDQISPENDLKWALIHPREGSDGYHFAPADAYVKFGLDHHLTLVGHTLVWHHQTPAWVFDASREELLERMRDHIHTVVGRYKGKIKVWDVVNEALSDDGPEPLRKSAWSQIIGPDFIAKAFQYAHEADPDAILRYNDYGLENPAKRQKLIALIKSLQAQNVPVMAIGTQTHVNVSWPSFEEMDRTLADLEALGLPIHVTELDVNGAVAGQRDAGADVAGNAAVTRGGLVEDADQRLAEQYANLFRAFRKHRKSVKMVTFWGVNDAVSWRAEGRPLLFDGDNRPKPAFDAVIRVATEKNSPAN